MLSWFKKKISPECDLPKLADWERECPDCAVRAGEIHDLFCLKERCPFCGGQLASCECIRIVLHLSEKECRALDEYVDDSVEPLRGIIERWRDALVTKGRIPYQPQLLPPSPDGLILASARGSLPFVRALLAKGIPINATNEVGYTPLMAAARCSCLEVVTFLLESGADVHLHDRYGHTALHCAVGSPVSHPSPAADEQAKCVRLLLKCGADVEARDQGGVTPLMNAAWFGCVPSVDVLLKAGADPKSRDAKGRTAEILARERKHEGIAARLAACV